MCFLNGRADLFENVDHPLDRKSPFLGDNLREGAAIEILHHETGHWTIRGACDTEFSNINDVGMSQAPGGFRFTSKTRDELIVSRKFRTNDFDRYGPLRTQVSSAIDRPHPALPQQLFDLIFIV